MNQITYYNTLEEFTNETLNLDTQYFLLVAENCDFSYEKLLNTKINFVGAIVTQIVYDEKHCAKGLLAIQLDEKTKTFLIEDIKDFSINKEELVNLNSITLLLDALSAHITPFLEKIFHTLPTNTEIIGGGAGKLTLKQEPVIFSNKGIFQDAALLIATNSHLSVGVENSWEYLQGPFIVTSSQKNVLKSLNFMNSFQIYKDVVEKDSGLKFDENNFFELAKSYPLGIVKFDKEIVVRDPIAKDENDNLILVGDLEQNSTINILKGDKQSLISSSQNAAKKALEKNTNIEYKNAILFDCISRAIFLDDDFKQELKAIKNSTPNNKLFGALTLGEIANNGNEYINFYNKTCVVGVLC